MKFIFKGKFTLRGKALTFEFHMEENPKRLVEDSRSYAETDIGLVPGPCNPYWGNLENALGAAPDDLNSYFTIWEADQPIGIRSGGAALPFILRARNGQYVRGGGSTGATLAATATEQKDALLLGTNGDWQTGAVLFALRLLADGSGDAEMLGNVHAQHTFKDQPESRIFLFLTKGFPATDPSCSFVLKQTPPYLDDILRWKAAQGSDLSWVAWPRYTDLSRVDMSDADLTGAQLIWTNFGNAKLVNANLTRARLDNSSLQPADLTGANLTETSFTGAYFWKANLSGAQMKSTNFWGANIRNVLFSDRPTFTNVNFRYVICEGLKLKNATFDGGDLTGVSMRRCDLSGVDFTKVKKLGDASFYRCNLARAIFSGCNFGEEAGTWRGAVPGHPEWEHPGWSNFQGSDLTGASLDHIKVFGFAFRAAILAGADFSYSTLVPGIFGSYWRGPDELGLESAPTFSKDPNNLTKFVGATLGFEFLGRDWSCLDLTDAKILDLPQDLTGLQASHLTAKGIDLSNRILKNAVFDNADLTNSTFSESDLTGASFKDAKLYGATFSYATLNSADFTGAQLGTITVGDNTIRAAVLSDANMIDAVFTDANLDGCVLNDVQWYGENAKADKATFHGAKISRANLSNLSLNKATLTDANFEGALLFKAKLAGAIAIRTAFTQAHLQGADFAEAKLNAADFTGAAVALENGVPLFALDAVVADDLNAARVSASIKTAFQHKGYTLLDKATVQVVTRGTKWTVSNADSAMPLTDLNSLYESFTILKTESGRLQVFGSTLWVTQVDNNEQLHSASMLCLPTTALEQDKCTMDDSLVFPSGHRLSELRSGEHTWEQMMTARTPLTPPKCVPDIHDWSKHCPLNQRDS